MHRGSEQKRIKNTSEQSTERVERTIDKEIVVRDVVPLSYCSTSIVAEMKDSGVHAEPDQNIRSRA